MFSFSMNRRCGYPHRNAAAPGNSFWCITHVVLTAFAAVSVIPSTKASADPTVECYGTVIAPDRVTLKASGDSLVDHVKVQSGMHVKQNDTIVELDCRELRIRLALAKQQLAKAESLAADNSEIEMAKSRLAKAEATHNAVSQLTQKPSLEVFRLKMDLHEAQAALRNAKLQQEQRRLDVEIKQHELDAVDLQVERCTIRSPFDGVVSDVLISGGATLRHGEPIATIVNMSNLQLKVEVPTAATAPHRLADHVAEVIWEHQPSETTPLRCVLSRVAPDGVDATFYYAFGDLQNSRLKDRRGQSHWNIQPGMRATVRLVPSVNVLESSLPSPSMQTAETNHQAHRNDLLGVRAD